MLNVLKCWAQSLSGLEKTIATFQRAYGDLQTPYALCEGLEIVVFNAAFADLFALDASFQDPKLLSDWTDEEHILEHLFAHPNCSFPVPCTLDQGQKRILNFTIHPFQTCKTFRLLSVNDRSELQTLHNQLARARATDQETGALLPQAFRSHLSTRIEHYANRGRGGLCILFELQQGTNPSLSEDLPTLTRQIIDRFSGEIDANCLVGKVDQSHLALVCETTSNGEEARYLLKQCSMILRDLVSNRNSAGCLAIAAAHYPTAANDGHDIIEAAELALVASKQTKAPVLFEEPVRECHARCQQLLQDFDHALLSGAIHPHFQPVIHAKTNRIKSFEALVRWQHPTYGAIAPPQIIELANSTRNLSRLTALMLQKSVEQMVDWPDPIQFAINVTPSQLTCELVDMVRRTVRNNNIDPARLEIEVTEDALIEDFEESARIFTRLRAIGVAVAMDDFGAGYTSVGNLRKLDFTKIKIDKVISDGLPDDPRSVGIVRALMVMARELNVEITVEGIETEEQLQFLRAFNCGVQGYVFSPPVPETALPELRRFLSPPPPQPRKVLGIGPRVSETA